MFKKLCGEDAFNNVAIVTTRWDQETKEVANRRLAELKDKPQLFKTVIDGGAEIFKHDHRSEESARKIIRHLINKSPKALLIQREMAEGKEVLETSAGQELQREIMEQTEKHRKEMAELLEEMEQTRDDAGIGELEEELGALRDRLARLQSESQSLARIPNASRLDLPASRKKSPAASDFPLIPNSTLVASTNVHSTSEQPDKFEHRTKVEKLERDRDQRRPGKTEKTVVDPGGVTFPKGGLRTLWNRVLRKVRRSPKLKHRIS